MPPDPGMLLAAPETGLFANGRELTGLFAPLMPVQTGPRRPLSACRGLWAAVLHVAVLDATATGSRVALDALCWLTAPEEGIGTCRWVCAHVGIDYEAMILRLLQGGVRGINFNLGQGGDRATIEMDPVGRARVECCRCTGHFWVRRDGRGRPRKDLLCWDCRREQKRKIA